MADTTLNVSGDGSSAVGSGFPVFEYSRVDITNLGRAQVRSLTDPARLMGAGWYGIGFGASGLYGSPLGRMILYNYVDFSGQWHLYLPPNGQAADTVWWHFMDGVEAEIVITWH